MIHKLHPIGYGTRRRRILGGSEILIRSGGGDKRHPAPLGRSNMALTFSTTYRSIIPICMTSVFWSHPSATFGTVWDGPCNYLLFNIFQECDVLVILQSTDDLGLDFLPYTFSMTMFEETLPRQHPDLENGIHRA